MYAKVALGWVGLVVVDGCLLAGKCEEDSSKVLYRVRVRRTGESMAAWRGILAINWIGRGAQVVGSRVSGLLLLDAMLLDL